jgi:hypothetical protein
MSSAFWAASRYQQAWMSSAILAAVEVFGSHPRSRISLKSSENQENAAISSRELLLALLKNCATLVGKVLVMHRQSPATAHSGKELYCILRPLYMLLVIHVGNFDFLGMLLLRLILREPFMQKNEVKLFSLYYFDIRLTLFSLSSRFKIF